MSHFRRYQNCIPSSYQKPLEKKQFAGDCSSKSEAVAENEHNSRDTTNEIAHDDKSSVGRSAGVRQDSKHKETAPFQCNGKPLCVVLC